ncbi:uncharacterized protein TRUGW13939_03170 [Talaromyces rugulosus]|uniref:Metallo-beta-lactamase domain-containing protein n=1 Tax=Talaromyces rugulosus TaxID=121627 RepID=A0A7H8QQ36_TALRU|nr:uncharacterized protein TRUGW13939_03170 [Talaromyces rugulosus]QKX56070.1 hypothetical protein TRUGW13939_03170 [Talaromyces rugulosus]
MSSLTFPTSPSVQVKISALEGGHLTLPERLFVTDADPEKKSTVPSLSFLIQHPSTSQNGTQKNENIVFDLGVKRDLKGYMPAMQAHIANRQPVLTSPDVTETLRKGGLDPAKDIDYVIMSHVHWDHVGTPADFERATFVVGHGTLHLLDNGAPPHYPKEIFDADLLPRDRVWELQASSLPEAKFGPDTEYLGEKAMAVSGKRWLPLKSVAGEVIFPAVVDLFDDGSVYLIDSPGHLFGHMNLLACVGPSKWVYLGGDCCHDPRILTGEKGIALYEDPTKAGHTRSVHVDTDIARTTLDRIKKLLPIVQPLKANDQNIRSIAGNAVIDGGEAVEIEVIVAHDKKWRENNQHRFFQANVDN